MTREIIDMRKLLEITKRIIEKEYSVILITIALEFLNNLGERGNNIDPSIQPIPSDATKMP